jgi:membrane-bound lytic murein transglycosylase D
MKQIFFLVFLVVITAIKSYSQTESDTLLSPIIYVENIDCLNVPNDTTHVFNSLLIPDSVYQQRLSALPFEFKMTYNPIVRQYIELYTCRIKDKLQVFIGLSDFYFPIIDESFKANQLPNELKYISIIESALNPRAVSRCRAVGLWQFMKGTGKENGLMINNYIDQRRGILESTNAAAKYLKTLYNKYNDWQLVLAAYNCGPGRVNKAIKRAKGKKDFWEIYKYLPRETRGYVPGFIGAAYAFNYFREHNIIPVPANIPLQTDTVNIFKQLYFEQVSAVLNVSIDVLRQINPQYLKDIIPANDNNQYSLRVPLDLKTKYYELKDSIYSHHISFFENKFQQTNKNNQEILSSIGAGNIITHKVHSGESIWLIANHYNVKVNNIKEWNNLTSNTIKIGQKLIVYLPKRS